MWTWHPPAKFIIYEEIQLHVVIELLWIVE